MAINNELNARLQHAVIGEGNTTTSSKPKKGEIIFNDNLNNFRVGDGEYIVGTTTPKSYSDLPDFIKPLSESEIGSARACSNFYITPEGNTSFINIDNFTTIVQLVVSYSSPDGIIITLQDPVPSSSSISNWSIKIDYQCFQNLPSTVLENNLFIEYRTSGLEHYYAPVQDYNFKRIKETGSIECTDGTIQYYLFTLYPSSVSFRGVSGEAKDYMHVCYDDGGILKTPIRQATSNCLGSIKVASSGVQGNYNVSSTGTYYPIETNADGKALVKIPDNISYPANTTYGQNPGLLQIATDAEPKRTYINNVNVLAVPVFYGKTKEEDEDEGTYYYKTNTGDYEKGEDNFEGHYVNIHDFVNGLVRSNELLAILRDALKAIW